LLRSWLEDVQEFMYLRFVFLLVCSSAKRETLDIVHAVRVIVYLQMQSAIRPAFGGIGTMSNLGKFTRFLVRIALAGACVMPLVFLSLQAQSTTAPTNSGAVYNSRFDFATLYSYFQAHGADTDVGISYNNIRLGEYASGSYYFNRRLGLEAAFESHPDGNNDGLYDVEAGPIVRDNMKHISLFAHGLVGMGRLAGPNTRTCCNLGYTYHNPWTWGGPSLTAGGGLDINLIRVVSLRLFQIDYTYNNVDFGPYVPNTYINRNPLGGRAHLPGLQASAGLVWHMGNITPPLPVSYSCSVSPSVGFPGDPITVTGMAMNLNPNPKKTVSYTWSSDGGTISGTTNVANLDTSNAGPGTYTVKGHVSQGLKPGQMADCSASFTVRAFDPPTISCSASPSSVNPGASSRITASAVSPQNRPLTYSYNATAGSISGTTPSATLSTGGAAPGPITVTCGVSDDKGHHMSATTSVNVIAPPPPPPPPPPPAPMASSLCSVSFERDAKRPTRVDNEAKACLDDVALALQRSSSAKLALVGNEDAKEQKADDKLAKLKHNKKPTDAAARAVNTKDYLVTEKGIDPSRILVYTGTDEGKTVTTTLIPTGASNPVASDTAVDESAVKAVPRTAVKKAPKKK
jgi:hypothetical protein